MKKILNKLIIFVVVITIVLSFCGCDHRKSTEFVRHTASQTMRSEFKLSLHCEDEIYVTNYENRLNILGATINSKDEDNVYEISLPYYAASINSLEIIASDKEVCLVDEDDNVILNKEDVISSAWYGISADLEVSDELGKQLEDKIHGITYLKTHENSYKVLCHFPEENHNIISITVAEITNDEIRFPTEKMLLQFIVSLSTEPFQAQVDVDSTQIS
jgi:hypothetical protein